MGNGTMLTPKRVNYALPNNEQEIDRLELQHRIWDIMLGGRLNLAPLSRDITHAIDIGCGTGAWAIEFADANPNCDVIGADLSPIQPDVVPRNLTFLVDDASAEWTYSTPFDYIHTRAISSGIKDWPAFLEQCFRHLKPGGWVELQEFHLPFTCDDSSTTPDTAVRTWSASLTSAIGKAGIDVSAENSYSHPKRLRDVGFINVEMINAKWPIGPWARGEKEKRIGALFLKDLEGNVENLSKRIMMGMMGMPEDEFAKTMELVLRDIRNSRHHMYMPV
ncbi:S-adenosyl-L-methionine-dependent methyltransferase [Rhizodiscina lignyota]|uniref:S-adenosyl-L-methionine-dependent methyltransferase n=1 Tax=Rhizodiscina lignyota TaxID=1504668 RepID=A0A9P4IQS4_9PEZI|nr:S-adenosyl-L-methionine-dependent methyltransferase [Rhizodiscina lignyota]